MASPSPSPSPKYRVCAIPSCLTRLFSLEKDGHTKCVSCRGQDCLKARCGECVDWPVSVYESWRKYFVKREKDKLRKREKSKDSIKVKDSVKASIKDVGLSDKSKVKVVGSVVKGDVPVSTEVTVSSGNIKESKDRHGKIKSSSKSELSESVRRVKESVRQSASTNKSVIEGQSMHEGVQDVCVLEVPAPVQDIMVDVVAGQEGPEDGGASPLFSPPGPVEPNFGGFPAGPSGNVSLTAPSLVLDDPPQSDDGSQVAELLIGTVTTVVDKVKSMEDTMAKFMAEVRAGGIGERAKQGDHAPLPRETLSSSPALARSCPPISAAVGAQQSAGATGGGPASSGREGQLGGGFGAEPRDLDPLLQQAAQLRTLAATPALRRSFSALLSGSARRRSKEDLVTPARPRSGGASLGPAVPPLAPSPAPQTCPLFPSGRPRAPAGGEPALPSSGLPSAGVPWSSTPLPFRLTTPASSSTVTTTVTTVVASAVVASAARCATVQSVPHPRVSPPDELTFARGFWPGVFGLPEAPPPVSGAQVQGSIPAPPVVTVDDGAVGRRVPVSSPLAPAPLLPSPAPLLPSSPLAPAPLTASPREPKPSVPASVPTTTADTSSVVILGSDDGAEEEGEGGLGVNTSNYRSLLSALSRFFPDAFCNEPPPGPSILMDKLVADAGLTDSPSASRRPKFGWSDTVLGAFSKADAGLLKSASEKKTSVSFSPGAISARRMACYEVEKLPEFGLSTESADFLTLVDSSRRGSLESSRVSWSQREMTSGLHSIFRSLEVISFLDWSLAASFLSVKELRDSLGPEQREKVNEALRLMSVSGKTLNDVAGELGSFYGNFLAKKRESFCHSLSRNVSQVEKSRLIFGEVKRDSLFDPKLVEDVSNNLEKKDTRDFMKRPATSLVQSLAKAQKTSSRGGGPSRFPTSSGRGASRRPPSGARRGRRGSKASPQFSRGRGGKK